VNEELRPLGGLDLRLERKADAASSMGPYAGDKPGSLSKLREVGRREDFSAAQWSDAILESLGMASPRDGKHSQQTCGSTCPSNDLPPCRYHVGAMLNAWVRRSLEPKRPSSLDKSKVFLNESGFGVATAPPAQAVKLLENKTNFSIG
jgi:hypothetical protein